jgi:AP endonuclease-2
VLDFGLFVLINLYCPNEGSDARFLYKMNYHLMLQERVRGLIAAGWEVVVIGDLNVCAAQIDHCDGTCLAMPPPSGSTQHGYGCGIGWHQRGL